MTEERRLAKIAQFYLQEAILTALDEHPDGMWLRHITEALNLPKIGFNSTATAQLQELRDQGRVHQPRGRKTEWALTPAERERRNG